MKKNGKERCVSKMRQWQSVTIGFIDADGKDDETEFDVYRVDTSAGLEELAQLFNDFCAENNFPTNTVQSVRVVKSADDYSSPVEMLWNRLKIPKRITSIKHLRERILMRCLSELSLW